MSITNLVSEVECVLPKRYFRVLIPTIQDMIFFLELRSFQSQSNKNEIIRVDQYDWYIVQRGNLNTGMEGNLCEEILGEVSTRLKGETEVMHLASQDLAELSCKPLEAGSEPGE